MKLTLPKPKASPRLFLAGLLLSGCASPPPSSPAPDGGRPPAASMTPAAVAPAVAEAPRAVAEALVAPPVARGVAWSTNWTPLLNGRDLTHWAITDFVAHGAVNVESNRVTLAAGGILTGINWTNGPLPKTDYELSLEALKSDGSDFFCGLTFPVDDSFCSLILGGWGGSVAGLSSVDDLDASENETSKHLFFEIGRWYHVRVRVTPAKIEAWLDQDKIVDLAIGGRKIALRPGPIEFSRPLGVAAYQTGAIVRNLRLHLTHP